VAFRRILVLGGARSGKSAFAERLATECGEPVMYVATATAGDEEMAERIARHRADRPSAWTTIEVQTQVAAQVAAALRQQGHASFFSGPTVLVEDLTLLLSNLMAEDVAQAESHARDELQGLLTLDAHVILVSNEVGMGIVPVQPLGRVFRDALGRLNQQAASACDEAYLLVAGLPLKLK
jgi:adenosylcobinamide kinase/adenosylcobinamide-phosphate guanylyltransferase